MIVAPVPASSAIDTALLGAPLTAHRAAPRARGPRRPTSSCSAASSSSRLAHLARRLDDGAAVVERRLRARRAHVPRAGVGVLVEDREVLGLHPEHLGREQRQAHHGAAAVLLRAGDDRPRAVGVELHVRARLGAERRPPAARDADRLAVGQLAARSRSARPPARASPSSRAGRTPAASGSPRPPRSACAGGARPDRGRARAASSSMCCSTAQHTCGAVGARIEPGRLVVRVDERRLDAHVLDHVRAARRASRPSARRSRPRRSRRRRRARAARGARRACRRGGRRSRARSPSPRAGGRARRTPPRARRRA